MTGLTYSGHARSRRQRCQLPKVRRRSSSLEAPGDPDCSSNCDCTKELPLGFRPTLDPSHTLSTLSHRIRRKQYYASPVWHPSFGRSQDMGVHNTCRYQILPEFPKNKTTFAQRQYPYLPGTPHSGPEPLGRKRRRVMLLTRRVYRSLLAGGRIPGFACMGMA